MDNNAEVTDNKVDKACDVQDTDNCQYLLTVVNFRGGISSLCKLKFQ